MRLNADGVQQKLKSAMTGAVVLCNLGLAGKVVAAEMASAERAVEVMQVVGTPIDGSSVVHLTDIQRKQANDLEDLFRDQGDIAVGGGFGAAQKIYVRGIEDMNLNVTIDGAAQMGQLFQHQGRLAIEPELLKLVEVKAGAGTALDGFGALGGAIRFETKSADDLLSPDEDFGALIRTGYYSNTSGYKASANVFARLNKQWNALLVAGKNDTDDIEDGRGHTLANTSTEQELGLFKLKGDIADGHTVAVSHEQRVDDGRRNLRTHFYAAPWNQAADQSSRRNTTTLNYGFKGDSDWLDLQVNAYQSENRFSYRTGTESGGAELKSTGLDVRNTSLVGQHEWVYGVETRKDQGVNYGNGARAENRLSAVYLQNQLTLTPGLAVSYGVRYDHYRLDDGFGRRFSASGFSPNVNVQYQLDKHWSLRTGYSTAMRGPQIRQGMVIGSVPHQSGLKKEKASNREFSLSWQDRGAMARFTLFRSEIDDVVSLVGPPGPGGNQRFANAGNLKTQGYNLQLHKHWQQLSVSASYSHLDPEIDGQPLNDGHFGIGTSYGDNLVLSAGYELPRWDMQLGWSTRLVKTLNRVPLGYPPKAGYSVHDVYWEWLPLGSDTLSLNLTISNLFDRHYFDHGTFGFDPDSNERIGLPEPGRDIRLTLGWKW